MSSAASQTPSKKDEATCTFAPVGLLAELTHRCPLQCSYCSNPIELERAGTELPADVWCDTLAQAADMGVLQLHLSGGEPTLREDLEQIVRQAAAVGLYSNLITAGVTLTKPRLEALAQAGLDHVQVSIQAVDEPTAARIAAFKDGLAKKRAVMGWVKDLGLPLTVNAPIHRQNIAQIDDIIRLAVEVGAERLEIANVQYYGWAFLNRAALMPTREQVLKSLVMVDEARRRLRGTLVIDYVAPDYYATRPKPCVGGWGRGIICITPSGKVLPCHAAESIPGLAFESIRERSLVDIWTTSSAFQAYRGSGWMAEPCRSCEHRERDFGGCRCQAYAMTGDASATDPACALSPRHAELVAIAEAEAHGAAPDFVYRNPRESVRRRTSR